MSDASARVIIQAFGATKGADPVTGELQGNLEQTDRWTSGNDSGEVSAVLLEDGSLAQNTTDSYDLLAAGSLTDINNVAIDADELKGIVLRVTSGTVQFQSAATNSLPLFTGAQHGLVLPSGSVVGVSLGAGGIDVSTNSKFEIVEPNISTATYELWLIVAQ